MTRSMTIGMTKSMTKGMTKSMTKGMTFGTYHPITEDITLYSVDYVLRVILNSNTQHPSARNITRETGYEKNKL